MEKTRNLAIVEEKAYKIRKNLQLTQKEFATVLGISKDYVSNMENGYRTMSIFHINKICNYANVSFDFMFDFCHEINQNIIKIDKIDLKIIGKHLKNIRKELNITQEKMAHKLNISRSMLALYESGNRLIKPDDLKQICELSGTSADWCIGKLDEKVNYQPIKKIKTSEIRNLIKS